MPTKIATILTIVLSTVSLQISAQNNAMYQLEKVKVADFNPISPVVDSNANAVVLAEIGSSEFEDNSNGDFIIVFKHTKRLLIRNKNAFNATTVKIPIYLGKSFTDEEKFEDFEAVTYNLKDGKIEETKLDNQSVFRELYNSERMYRKFTFSNVKEGCIVEFKYTVKSPFDIFYRYLRSWQFEGKYPILWSQYHIVVPPMFSYYVLRQGHVPYTVDTTKTIYKTFRIMLNGDAYTHSQIIKLSGDSKFHLWAIKNVPAIKIENYSPSFLNYITKIDFPLLSIHYTQSSPTIEIIKRWPDAISTLLLKPDYAYTLASDMTPWLNDEMKKFTVMVNSYEKAKSIYNHVRDNYKCTNHDASVWLSEPIKKIYQSKSGSVTDINLILMAMLAHEGFDVHPVILSTKDNGYVTEEAPILQQYNYVLARVKIDTSYYLLDASEPKLGFGKLSPNCYNHSARVLDDSATLLSLHNDDITEAKSTVVFIGNDEKGGITGTYNTTLGDAESLAMREDYENKVEENYTKALVKNYPSEVEISNVQIDSFKVYEAPITLHYDVKLQLNDADVLYVSPMFNDALVSNPFTASERFFPLEMPNKTNHVYTLNLEVPKGYKVDEIPKSVKVKLNDNQGMFEYITVFDGNNIQLRSKLIINKATFAAEEYQTIRDFFAFVVKKHAEQIVFKKIKK